MATQTKKINNVSSKSNISKQEKNDEVASPLDATQENHATIDDRDEIIQQLKEDNKKKDDDLKNLSESFAKMQEQLNSLLQSQQMGHSVLPNEEIEIGCRAINGGVLATSDGRYSISFLCDEKKFVDSDDFKTILKESGLRNTKKFFEDDIFYFVDKGNYDKFKIKKRVDLSRENISRILMLPSHSMIDEINALTNNLVDFTVVHTLQFEIVKMLIDTEAPLKNWNYDNRAALERYLNRKFDDLMAAVGAIELLGRKKFS